PGRPATSQAIGLPCPAWYLPPTRATRAELTSYRVLTHVLPSDHTPSICCLPSGARGARPRGRRREAPRRPLRPRRVRLGEDEQPGDVVAVSGRARNVFASRTYPGG